MRITTTSKNNDKTVFLKDRFIINGKKYNYKETKFIDGKQEVILIVDSNNYTYNTKVKEIRRLFNSNRITMIVLIVIVLSIVSLLGLFSIGLATESSKITKPNIKYEEKNNFQEQLEENFKSEHEGLKELKKTQNTATLIETEEEKKKKEKERQKEDEIKETKQWEYYEKKDYKVNQSSDAKEKTAALIKYAKYHLGAKYTYGGASWKTGVDCSGFTMLCYGKFGVNLPHYSESQALYGKEVKSLAEAVAGDLICYYGHVGIYLGKNKMIHSSTPKTGVIITNGVTYRKIKTIRRLFN